MVFSKKAVVVFSTVVVHKIEAQKAGRSRNYPRIPANLEPQRLGVHGVRAGVAFGSSLGEVRESSPRGFRLRQARRRRDQ